MARIRNIKPEFWTDEKLVELEPWERLLFIGLWSFADDEGFLAYSPKRIKMQVFPGDALEVSRGLTSLLRMGALALYSVGSDPEPQVLRIVNWSRHQKPAHPTPSKWRGSDLHLCPTPAPDSRGFTSPHESSVWKGKGKGEGKGEELPRASAPHEVETGGAAPDGAGAFDEFWSAYPSKKGKADALKAWRTKRCSRIAEQVIAGAIRYRDDPNRDPAFTKLPAGWLRDGRWDDDPLPARRPTNRIEAEEQARQARRNRWMAEAQAEQQHLALVAAPEPKEVDPWTA